MRKIADEGLFADAVDNFNGASLTSAEELDLIKKLDSLPGLLEIAARTLEPHRVTYFLDELAAQLHSYYNRNRVISEDGKVSGDRLLLFATIQQVIKICLALLGVSSPEKM
jgi:arginyl-tRNA synthetase